MIPIRIAALAAILLALIVPAQARHRHHHIQVQAQTQNVIICNLQGCSDHPLAQSASVKTRSRNQSSYHVTKTAVGPSEGFLPHPSGCPRTLFCACGASVEIFGRSIRALWPARAWYRFPRAIPAYKTVAVSSHHVFVLISQVEGTNWLVHDYNSGGHLSREHVINIRGWTIVRPVERYSMN